MISMIAVTSKEGAQSSQNDSGYVMLDGQCNLERFYKPKPL